MCIGWLFKEMYAEAAIHSEKTKVTTSFWQLKPFLNNDSVLSVSE